MVDRPSQNIQSISKWIQKPVAKNLWVIVKFSSFVRQTNVSDDASEAAKKIDKLKNVCSLHAFIELAACKCILCFFLLSLSFRCFFFASFCCQTNPRLPIGHKHTPNYRNILSSSCQMSIYRDLFHWNFILSSHLTSSLAFHAHGFFLLHRKDFY